jgi:DNA processing protein
MINLDKDYPIKVIDIKDNKYPKSLKEIKNAPKKLYYRGNLEENEKLFAIVGTRNPSLYGKEVTIKFSQYLCEAGLIIVSGFATGIDTFAHETVVENKKKTIAILGTGLDERSIYPKSNLLLAKKILENNGCLISEYPQGTRGTKFTFPQRNRIISGISLGVLVVEAKEKSGALITAEIALKQNKKVFAVPGPINSSNSKGPNNLLKNKKAIFVDCPQDILEHLNIEYKENKISNKNLEEENSYENIILNVLAKESLHIDKIIEKTKLSSSQVASTLAILEIKGKVINLGGNNYAISSS